MLTVIMVFTMVSAGIPIRAMAAAGDTIKGDPVTVEVGHAAIARENNINKGWKFYLGTSSTAHTQNFDDSSWDSVDLPHDFSIFQSFTTSGEAESGFLPGGTGWYRKTLVMSEEQAGKTILLNFDGVYMNATVYVNGQQVGTHNYGYTSFAFDITDKLVCDGVTENVIAVKAVNESKTSRWYSGSGIYRDVELLVLNPVHVDLNGTAVTTPNIASGNGTVRVAAEIVNDGSAAASVTVKNTVYKKGSASALATASASATVAAGATTKITSSPVVSNPSLWSVSSPNLYTVVTEVSVGGQVVDTYESEFGFRWFEFKSTGFYLNGQALKLNGVCMHHDQGALGSAAYYDAMYRQMSIMKDMGVNAIRTSHNPADEDFISICSELGLLVIEETFDGLVDYKNYNTNDFSKYFETTANSGLYGFTSGMTCAEYAARSNVRRDRNAPCVFAWSFGNEIQEGTYWTNVSRYDDICASYIQWVNAEDGTRVITSGDNNRGGDSDLVNVIRTITNAGGVAGFNYANTATQLYSLSQSYGGNYGCIIASETSSAINSRGMYKGQASASNIDGKYHLTSYDTSSVSWGITAHDSIYNTYQYDSVAGEFVWTGFDYIGEPTPWNGTSSGSVSGSGATPNSSYFGIVETTGFEKDTYYLYRSQWNKDATTVHLVTAWDADNQYVSGSTTPVWLYSNAPKVELYLNGSLIATSTRTARTSAAGHTYYTYTSTSNNTSVCTVSNGSGADALYGAYNIRYTAGTLSTKAYDANGKEIALNDSMGRYTVSTPDAASKLAVSTWTREDALAADGSSLLYIEVDVTDANGRLDTAATNKITFTLTGNGEIMGVDNGDQATTAKYQQSSVLTSSTSANINAYAGKALAIVRTTDDAGSIQVNVASSGMTTQTVKVNTTAVSTEVTDGLLSYTMVRDYSVMAGNVPALETTATGILADNSTVTGTIVWDNIPASVYTVPGDYTVNGVLTVGGETIQVSAKLHVINNVVAMRNVSTATTVNQVPTLPNVVQGVLADGTISGEFAVTWDAVNANALSTVGSVVTVNGTASVLGGVTLPVTCAIRVAQEVQTESTNIAPDYLKLEQDVPAGMQSDNLYSIVDGVVSPADSVETRWTNWANRYSDDSAAITLTWATAHNLSEVNLYYRLDGSCKHPASVTFSYSLNGIDFVEVGATETQITGMSINYGSAYNYTLDKVINPVALRVTFTQQNGTSSGYCVGLYEIEAMTYAAELEYNASADLSGITVDGAAISGFSANTLHYQASGSTVAAATAVNAGITVLPANDGVVRILTVSEDGTASKTYEVTLTGGQVCGHANKEVRNASDATCTATGYTGDTWCLDCGKLIASGTQIAATGHQHTEVRNAYAATCTATGYTGDTYCLDCGKLTASGTQIAAFGHQHTEVRNAYAATCTATGYTGDTYCLDCGKLAASGTQLAAKGHSWNSGVITQQATSTTDGIKTYTCYTCGGTKTEVIPAVKNMKTPSVSVSVSRASGSKLTITGKVDDFANIEDYYTITAHGLLYIQSSKIGNRVLHFNTAGRTKVNCSSYASDGSFSYTFTPSKTSTAYTVRAYITYTDADGNSVTVYSSTLRGSYNSFR